MKDVGRHEIVDGEKTYRLVMPGGWRFYCNADHVRQIVKIAVGKRLPEKFRHPHKYVAPDWLLADVAYEVGIHPEDILDLMSRKPYRFP